MATLRHMNKSAAGCRTIAFSTSKHILISAASGAESRLLQFQELLEDEKLRLSLGFGHLHSCKYFPPHIPLDDPKLWEWFKGLGDGVDVVSHVNGLGKSAEAQANSRANRDKFAEEHRYNTRDPKDFPKFFEENREMTANAVTVALKRLSCLESIQKFKKHRNIAFCLRFCKCHRCGEIIFSYNAFSHHFCLVDGEIKSFNVTIKNFPTLQRITFIHDLLSIPDLSNLVGTQDTPTTFTLFHNIAKEVKFSHFQCYSTLYILNSNSNLLPSHFNISSIPPTSKIWVKPEDVDNTSWLLTLAVDATISYVSTFSFSFPVGSDSIDTPWRKDSMKKVFDLLGE